MLIVVGNSSVHVGWVLKLHWVMAHAGSGTTSYSGSWHFKGFTDATNVKSEPGGTFTVGLFYYLSAVPLADMP